MLRRIRCDYEFLQLSPVRYTVVSNMVCSWREPKISTFWRKMQHLHDILTFPDATIHVECLWGVVEHDYTQLARFLVIVGGQQAHTFDLRCLLGSTPIFGCVLSFPHGCGRYRGLVLDPKVLVGQKCPSHATQKIPDLQF